MLIDSHCHLSMSDFNNDLDSVISNAHKNSVQGLLNICTELNELKNLKLISKKHNNIWYSGGVHPCNVKTHFKSELDYILQYSTDKNLVGIGETGLDYYHDNKDKEMQQISFIKHINIARELELPVIIHTREADKDTIRILKEEYKKGHFKGVIHCFTATEELALEALSIGFYISISGIITFKNAASIRKTIKNVPIDKLLVETDAPYLAPVPKRGRRNEPAFVKHTAEYLSNLKEISFEKLSTATTENFFNLFDKANYQ
tara:strand:+ start:118 stop:897 length:780 start_codon:yes stop_codon:yes gene_type:complete